MLIAETFKALGDPTRLKMIERLSDGSPHTLGSVSKDLGLTRQGARKHLKVLADAELVKLVPRGRQTAITFKPTALKNANSFIEGIEQQWVNRLQALRAYVESNNSEQ